MAGFFGFFDYSKPGPGVPKDAPPKSRFIVFFEVYFRKFWKLIQLSMLYTIACIPIFTIGPATAGFTYVLRNFAREEHAWVWSDFKEHFVKNFKQAFIVGLVDFIAIVMGYFNYSFYSQVGSSQPIYIYLKYFMVVVGIIFIMMHFYIYPMLVTFKLNLKQLYKNSLIMTFYKLPQNVLILLVCTALLFAFYWFLDIFAILLTPFIVFGTIGFIINFYAYPVIKKLMMDTIEQNKEEQIEEEIQKEIDEQ